MSLSMKQKLLQRIDKIKEEEERRRQSFSARICDPLCEELLKHLTLKEKVRLQKVSKQFQRTIFLSFNRLNITSGVFWAEDVWDQSLTFNWKSFETIVKKCPNIKSIDLMSKSRSKRLLIVDYNSIIASIGRYCHKLEEIRFWFNYFNVRFYDPFLKKFGANLKSLKLYSFYRIDYINSFENLRKLSLRIDDFNMTDVCALQLPRLQYLRITSLKDSDSLVILPILLNNHQSIESLAINSFTTNELTLNSIFAEISKLHNLVKLKFFTPFGLNDKKLEKSMKQMAKNCLKLNTIHCMVSINLNNFLDMDQLLSSLKPLKQLRYLKLCIDYHEFLEENTLFSCQVFKGFEYLTHLTLSFFNDYVEDMIFADIDINLPNIQYLNVRAEIQALDWTHIILSRLTELKTIKLQISSDHMRDIIANKLRHNCPKLKTIDIS